jgi:hypothetical protein
MKIYCVKRASGDVPVLADWDAPSWRDVPPLTVEAFRPESSDHHPATSVKLQYSDDALHLAYLVEDRYVRAVSPGYNAGVCTDSCVEFFVRPAPEAGYLNFEMNCGGTMLIHYIEDWRRTATGFEKCTPVPEELGRTVSVAASMPARVDPEIAEPTTWTLFLRIPTSLLETYVGKLGRLAGSTWRANFYKCGDETSHPHWAAWSPVPELNFHDPESFGEITFA